MSLTDKIYNLSTLTQNGGYITPDLDITIWLLEKCNSVDARVKLAELYLSNKYSISFKSIKEMMQLNINQNDIYSKYLLSNIYLVNNKYEYVYNLLNNELTFEEINEIKSKKDILLINHLLFFMGIYILDNINDIELGTKYLEIYFEDKSKNTGIYKYLQYKYFNKPTLREAYIEGDLYSCYIFAEQTDEINYYNEYISRYSSNFYRENLNCDYDGKFIPNKSKLKLLYEQSKLHVVTYNIINNLSTNKLKNNIKLLQKYIVQNDKFTKSLRYKIGIAGLHKSIEPSELFFNKMLECSYDCYADSKYYLGIMYYKGYGTNKNTSISLELLCNYIKNSRNIITDIYYYIITINYEDNNFINVIDFYNENCNEIDNKLNEELLGKCYYILSLIYQDKNLINIKDSIKYLKKAIKCNNMDAYYKMGLLLSEGKYIQKDNKEAIENFTYASNNGHHDSLCNLAYYYYNGIDIEQNTEMALSIWKKLAELDNSNAIYYLGIYYKSINNHSYITYIKKSAELNNNNALYDLSQFYNEIGKSNDYLKCLKQSAKYGNTQAINDLYNLSLEYKDNDNIDEYLELLNLCSSYGSEIAKQDLIDYTNIEDLRKI